MDDEGQVETPIRRIKKRHLFGVVLLLLLALVAIAWWQRLNIANRLVRDQLEKAGVNATYKIESIGFRTQRLSNIVVGDPANPDLTARSVEVNVKVGFQTPEIQSIWAEGVRLQGRYADGKLSFGELDKFRDPKSKKPFELPDIKVLARDVSLSLATPWGGMGIAANFRGNLQRSIFGQAAFRSPVLSGGGCNGRALRFDGDFAYESRKPSIDGPITATSLLCPKLGLALANPALDGEFRLTEKFDRWIGDTRFTAANLRYAGHLLEKPIGAVSFDGGGERTNYEFKLDNSRYRSAAVRIEKLSGDATGDVSFNKSGFALSARGRADIGGGLADTPWLNGLATLARKTAETPIGPVIAQLDPALRGVLRSFSAAMTYDAAIGGGKPVTAIISGLNLKSAAGAKLRQTGPLEIRGGALRGSIQMAMEGGGLPSGGLMLLPQGKGWSGTLALAPYAAKGGMIDLPRLAFNGVQSGNWNFTGQATLSGPLLGGRVEGLSIPVDGSWTGGRFTLLRGCNNVRFQSFRTGSFSLPGQTVRACSSGGSILQVGPGGTQPAFTSPALAGNAQLGGTPVRYSGSQVRFSLDSGFVARNVSVDLGKGTSSTKFTMSDLEGRFASGGFEGTLKNAFATIGSVPLLSENANGEWSYIRNILKLEAALTVSDAEQVDRFKTLNVPDLALTLEDGLISALANLHEPTTGIQIAGVDIQHNLTTAKGRALFAVDGLNFNEKLQPDMLTPLTLGAIANVIGRIDGDGRIEWDSKGVNSSGRFSTRSLDFAAAFGPVTGLSTDVAFTDLLGLETASGQLARIAVVNPGVPALDGQLRYRLLPDQKVQILEGRWPFYGGELILEETTLDFDVEAKRNLTFRMVGLDSEKFLAGYDLENIRVSGVFDGTLPMVFDQEGGKIVGGWLVSRKGGGEVSYLGQLSYEEMGVFANYAFEALRSIRYEEMQIGVDGNIGGEVVTEVRFRGLQQGSKAKRNYITKQLAKLPIQFNVRIEAEFLSLIGSMRALYDAEYAAQRYKGLLDKKEPITGTEETKP